MDSHLLKDEQLIELYRKNNDEFYRSCLYRKYERYLRATAFSFANSVRKYFIEEDDIFIEISCAFYKAIDTYKKELGEFFYYMRVIIARTGCSFLKKATLEKEKIEKMQAPYNGISRLKNSSFEFQEPEAVYEEQFASEWDAERTFMLFYTFLEKRFTPQEMRIVSYYLAKYSIKEIMEKEKVARRRVLTTFKKVRQAWVSASFQSKLKSGK